ncbi:Thaumatin, conserved site [Sesbania bispinosa]|nr:Thaumatin, conserved site [Sesbania bispinosa]
MPTSLHHFIFFFLLLSISLTADGTQLIIVNNCKESVWPGILGNAGHPSLKDGGFHLASGEEVVLQVPKGWSGRIWGRQGCCFDEQTGRGSCQTGDCAGLLQCRGIGGVPPATLVEMTFGTSQSPLHFYDVSLVDGFNLPVSMRPVGGGDGGCGVASCEGNLNVYCPSALVLEQNGKVVGCKSAAAKSDRYCCTGEFANPKTCKPTVFSRLFKTICPHAYSYAYDDSSGLKTCKAPLYVITFCPPH